MKSLPVNCDVLIDHDAEVQAITDFVRKGWAHGDLNLPLIVRRAYEAGIEKGARFVDGLSTTSKFLEMSNQRREFLKGLGGDMAEHSHYDGIKTLLDQAYDGSNEVCGAWMKGWNYSQEADAVHAAIRKEVGLLNALKPFGYAEFTADYNDYQGMADYDLKADQARFQGHDSSGVRSGDLIERISLPQVAYADIGQGRSPARELISSIFSHALYLTQFNRDQEIQQELAAYPIDCEFVNEEVVPTGKYLSLFCKHAADCYKYDGPLTDEIIEEARRRKAEYDALSPEEKAELKRQNEEAMRKMIDEIMKEMD